MIKTFPGKITVMITNDDGVEAVGLETALGAVRSNGWTGQVAAPAWDVSSTSMAVGRIADTWIKTTPVDWTDRGHPGTTVTKVAQYPATLVVLANHGAFGPRPDMVLVGVNHGLNTGVGIFHSGTVGAALTGSMAGIPSMAVSVDDQGGPVDWQWCRRALAVVLNALHASGAVASGIVNLNMPSSPDRHSGYFGWQPLARTGTRKAALESRVNDDGIRQVRLGFTPIDRPARVTDDTSAAQAGDVVLTWVQWPQRILAPPPSWHEAVSLEIAKGWKTEFGATVTERMPDTADDAT